jgi:hypothetical protein
MAAGKKRGAPAPRPRSGFVTEDQRHTVRVRVSRGPAAALADRWGLKVEDAVREAVVRMSVKHCDWVTDGERTGVVIHRKVLWLGGGESPVSDALRVLSQEEAQRALAAAGQSSTGQEGT